ncbi:MAG TPA: DUF3492 domain-containing protein [Acidimicrobiales bacterium]|nr:DUF3492 domain-containing protein [Acidimicrobiales bacterium]
MRIYLSTEGTYPFVLGGVSTWADLLVRGLEDYEFHVAAIVDNPFHPLAFKPPRNVTLQAVPLWGSEMIDEYLSVPGSWRRALRTSRAEVRRRFLPCWEPFVDALAVRESPSAALGDTLAEVAKFAERYDLRKALASQATWSVLLERLRSNALTARVSSKSAIDFGRALFRFLLPLCAPIPRSDVAHMSAAGLCALPVIVSKYRYGTPVLLTEHGIYLRERVMASSALGVEDKFLLVNFYRAVTELAYRIADVLAPVCAYNSSWEVALGVDPGRIRVVHNGLPGGELAHLGPVLPAGPPTIGFIGRIDPLKDVVTLLRAFARVHKELPEARLRLWGPASSPAYMSECQQVAADLGLLRADSGGSAGSRGGARHGHPPVTFEGRTSDLPTAYGACHVIALSSITEGFPYTVVESMLAARLVVATDVGGVREAIGTVSVGPPGLGDAKSASSGTNEQPQAGSWAGARSDLLVDPGDPQALARALLRALRAPERQRLAVALALRERAQAQFNVSNFLGGYSEVYQQLAARGSQPLAGAVGAA